ncbi:MAG: MotA/TolQ/ExbB proton channel family protein [Campylobacterota bacterium]|nr:MotA/TolQ/ExbB proton channel family protein [Campylobacterota bacterium]
MQATKSHAKCSANFIVISTIPILFFVSMILGYIGIIPLNVPIHALAVIGFILFIFLLFIKHNANYSICKMRLSYGQLKEDLDAKLSSSTLTINGQTKSLLDIDAFLNRYYSDMRNDNFVSVASSIFPMLGILGTFVAIAISMPDFSVTDTEALDNEISVLLSGVGSAFFASIYGILLSLIWTYFEKSGMSKVERYFSTIKANFEDELWSKEELLIYKYTQYDMKDNNFISALQDTFNLDFIQRINREHLASFDSVMQTANKNFTDISQNLQLVSTELQSTLAEMNNGQSALSAQNHIDKSLVDFTVATKSFEKSSKLYSAQLNNSLNRTFEKIDSEVGDIVIKLADFATHVSLESREVQDSISKYHHTIASQIKD